MTRLSRCAALALAAATLAGCGGEEHLASGGACVDEFQRNVATFTSSYGAPLLAGPEHGGGPGWSRTARFPTGGSMIEVVAIYREAQAERAETCEIFAHYAKLDPDKAKEMAQQAKASH